jgi:hypothetical protein
MLLLLLLISIVYSLDINHISNSDSNFTTTYLSSIYKHRALIEKRAYVVTGVQSKIAQSMGMNVYDEDLYGLRLKSILIDGLLGTRDSSFALLLVDHLGIKIQFSQDVIRTIVRFQYEENKHPWTTTPEIQNNFLYSETLLSAVVEEIHNRIIPFTIGNKWQFV